MPLLSDKSLMKDLVLLFYSKSKDKSFIYLIHFTPPMLCSALSLHGEQHILCPVTYLQLLQKAFKKTFHHIMPNLYFQKMILNPFRE